MKILQGIGASSKATIGKAIRLEKPKHYFQTDAIEVPNRELEKFQKAMQRAKQELSGFISDLKAKRSPNYQIFVAHAEMIGDVLLIDEVEDMIRQGKSAEYAVDCACNHFYKLLETADDEYLRQRKDDVQDVKERLLNALSVPEGPKAFKDEEFIVVADRIYPSDIMALAKYKTLGFVTKYGSVYSHTAILARSMDLPYICQLETEADMIRDGDDLILDGRSGEVFLSPDEETLKVYRSVILRQAEKVAMHVAPGNRLKAVTKSGLAVEIKANANHVYDLEMILKQDSDGIGLVRSEYLFAENKFYPSEEEQAQVYSQFLTRMAPLATTIRTFDFGMDKPNQFLAYEKEENPALGYRGIRISLQEKPFFKAQLRALYRSSISGKLKIMFPMITTIDQVLEIKALVEEVKTELDKEGFHFDKDVELGLMIETPASAIISDLLAEEVDFFSIGTNDLVQYTLASDRQNIKIAALYDDRHPAIRRLIAMTTANARQAGIKVALCGEMAENMDFLDFFLECGITELSVSPSKINQIKMEIINHE